MKVRGLLDWSPGIERMVMALEAEMRDKFPEGLVYIAKAASMKAIRKSLDDLDWANRTQNIVLAKLALRVYVDTMRVTPQLITRRSLQGVLMGLHSRSREIRRLALLACLDLIPLAPYLIYTPTHFAKPKCITFVRIHRVLCRTPIIGGLIVSIPIYQRLFSFLTAYLLLFREAIVKRQYDLYIAAQLIQRDRQEIAELRKIRNRMGQADYAKKLAFLEGCIEYERAQHMFP